MKWQPASWSMKSGARHRGWRLKREKARLRQELDQLQQSEKQIQAQNASRVELEAQVTDAREALDKVEQAISQRTALDADLQAARQ